MIEEDNSYSLSEIPDDFASGASELTEGQKAQIKMTYWVLGGAAMLLLFSGGFYIFFENGVAAFAEDVRLFCGNGMTEAAEAFCKKYLTEQYTVANTAAKEFFEFCKSFIPPVVTLVLGAHYVTKSSDSSA